MSYAKTTNPDLEQARESRAQPANSSITNFFFGVEISEGGAKVFGPECGIPSPTSGPFVGPPFKKDETLEKCEHVPRIDARWNLSSICLFVSLLEDSLVFVVDRNLDLNASADIERHGCLEAPSC